MKTKKRVKELEKEFKVLKREVEQLKNNQDDILENLSELTSCINEIAGNINNLPVGTVSSEVDKKLLKETVTQLKKYVDSQIEADRKNQLSKEEIQTIINKNNEYNNACIINEIKDMLKNYDNANLQHVQSPIVDVDYDRINYNIVQAVNRAFDSESVRFDALMYEIEQMKNRVDKLESLKNSKKPEQRQDIEKTEPTKPRRKVSNDNKTDAGKTNDLPVSQASTDIVAASPLFSNNLLRNEKMLSNILGNAKELRNKYYSIIEDNVENSVYFKTVDNCVKKLEKLTEKISLKEMEPSKIAGELVKILNSTIVKNFVKRELHSVIDQFMTDCSFIRKELYVGKKLSDEDYDFIGEMPLDVPVDSADQHNVIQAKEHDAYLIYYKDEEGLSYRVIDGKYSIGKYSK